jgi:hypothetical protein
LDTQRVDYGAVEHGAVLSVPLVVLRHRRKKARGRAGVRETS